MLFMGIVNNNSVIQPSTLLRKVRDSASPGKLRERGLYRRAQPGFDINRPLFAPDPLGSDEVPSALLHHFEMAQTRTGRLAFNTYLWCQKTRLICHNAAPAVIKRGVDVTASLVLLLILSPLFALIALLVKLESPGPVFFAQKRVGLNGREFKMYKIRSMCLGAEERLIEVLNSNQQREGVTFKLKDDPRITRVGKWLRKLSLDELPQLYNVLTGSMSLVGPRPPVPREVEMYTLADRRRLSIKPGITCTWQISGRTEIDFSGQVKLDVNYIENQSLMKDLSILLRTLPAVISGRGAC